MYEKPPAKKRWCFCRLFLAIFAPKSSIKVLELSETISLKCTWYFKKKIESTKNSPKLYFWGFMWFHVTISHMFILYIIYPYISYPSSHDFWETLICHFRNLQPIPTGLTTVGHGYQCQQFLAYPPTQDAWETTTPVILSVFSRGNLDKPTFICHFLDADHLLPSCIYDVRCRLVAPNVVSANRQPMTDSTNLKNISPHCQKGTTRDCQAVFFNPWQRGKFKTCFTPGHCRLVWKGLTQFFFILP